MKMNRDFSSNLIRTDKRFKKWLREVSKERFKSDIDSDFKPRTNRELTKMMMNAPSFKNIEEELLKLPRKEDLK